MYKRPSVTTARVFFCSFMPTVYDFVQFFCYFRPSSRVYTRQESRR